MTSNVGHSDDAKIASLTVRVGGLEQSISLIGSKLDGMASKMDDRSRTPWAIIIGFAAISITSTTAIVGGITAPIYSNINRLESAFNNYQSRTEGAVKDVATNAVPMTMFLDFKASYNSNREISRNEYLDKFNNVKSDQQKDFENLQRQMDEVRNSLGGAYSLKDYVQRAEKNSDEMNARLNQIETKLPKGAIQ